MVVNDGKWVCIIVSRSYRRGDRDAITTAIKRIFGDDLKEVLFVCDEVMWQSGEYYCFVRCDDYSSHISQLRENSLFFQVVPKYDKPNFLSTEDVENFIESVKKSGNKADFARGDVVVIKEGYLKGLCGLVMDRHSCSKKQNKYKVSFHFCTKSFVEVLPKSCLQFLCNLFTNKKFPVTKKSLEDGHVYCGCFDQELQEALHKIVNKYKIHWKKNRGRIKSR